MSSSEIAYRSCWVAYFDLLGFRSRVEGNELAGVLSAYLEVLKAIRREDSRQVAAGACNVRNKWFSDTFLFYALDDSIKSFWAMDFTCRGFFHRMILKRIPLRGSLTVGSLYGESLNVLLGGNPGVDETRAKLHDVLVGPALIEAYDYAERQDWIGFVLTPNAREKLSGDKVDGRPVLDVVMEHYYRDYGVPMKPKRGSGRRETQKLPACTMNFTRFNHGTQYADEAMRVREALKDMEVMASDEWGDRQGGKDVQACSDESASVRRKYANTMTFFSETVPNLAE